MKHYAEYEIRYTYICHVLTKNINLKIMKKNLRNVLVLSLGLITTIASAQWSASSNTWIDNTNSDDRNGFTRSTVTLDMSGVHISGDHYWNTDGTTSQGLYEAYVSTDVMGFGTLTLGRQDLSFGSGVLVSSSNWGANRYTTDGMDFSMSLSGININAGTMGGINTDVNYINASGEFAGVSINALMIDNQDVKSNAYDLGYSMMNGDLNLSYTMADDGYDTEMTRMGVSYNVFENLSVHGHMTQYEGESAVGTVFNAPMSSMSEGLSDGVMPHLANGEEAMSYGLSYDLGDIAFSYTMHNVSETDGDAEVDFTDLSLSYQLNDNCSLGYRSWKIDDTDYTFITVGIGL